MSEESRNPAISSDVPHRSDAATPEGVGPKTGGEKKAPSLLDYFGEKRIGAGVFLKDLRAAHLNHFEESDRAEALALMHKNDPEGERLWSLMCARRLPDPVKGWIWSAARAYLNRVLRIDSDVVNATPKELIEAVRKRFPLLSSTKDKSENRAFTSSVRIVASWLLNKHRLEPWDVVESCGALVCKNESAARERTSTALRAGSAKDFDLAACVGLLGRRRLADAQNEVAQAKDETLGLLQRIERKTAENAALTTDVETLQLQNAELAKQVNDLEIQIETERQHTGYDVAQLKANNAILLRERLRPLIQDAIDSLEIETPAPHIAISRLKKAASTIEESI